MINFDEEIQNLIDESVLGIPNNDVPDITDLISQILGGKNSDK